MALIAALVLLYNKCEWFRDGVNAILSFFKEKLGAALEAVSKIFGAIGSVIGRVMEAAKATVQEKLDNMKRAYEEHGGGILGVAAAAVEGIRGITEAGFNTLNNLTGGKLDGLKAAYEEYGGGIQGAAVAAVEGVKGAFTAGYRFLDNLTGGKLTEIKDKFSEKLSPITGTVGSILDAAGATASEKLKNMLTAYEQHGGGVQGIAAAAIEGVKGYYTAGFTFLDNLTGGKLTEISGKFMSAMSGIVQGVSQKFTDAHTAFTNGLSNIKNTVTGAVTWFFDSGKKVVSTFASGITSAFSGAVDAVKGGLQKIRNLLPFSDAKEGPLSTLTLSGQRTMSTYAHGLALAQDAPADEMERGLQKAKTALEREPVKKVNITGTSSDEDTGTTEGNGSGNSGKQVIIQKLIMQVDPKKIKDLQMLISLLKEVEDYTNGNGDDDPDAVPSTA